MFTQTAATTFESGRVFTARTRDVLRAHLRQLATGSGRVASRARAVVGQIISHARALAGRVGAAAAVRLTPSTRPSVQDGSRLPSTVTALLVAGTAVAAALVAVAIRRG